MGNLWAGYALFITMLFMVTILFSFYLYIVKPNRIKKSFTLSKEKLNEFSPTIKFLLFVVVLLVIIGFWMPFFLTRASFVKELDFTKTGSIGDTFGGILNPFVALAAVIVTGLAFYMQYQANQQVQDQFKIQQFESQFYKLLDFHKQNVSDMQFKLNNDEATGRKVIKLIVDQIEVAFREISPFFKDLEIQNIVRKEYLQKFENIKQSRSNIDLVNLITLDIAYTIVFVGISNRDQYPFFRILLKKYKLPIVKNVYHLIRLKPANSIFKNEWNTILRKVDSVVDFEKLKKTWNSELEDEYHMQQLYQYINFENAEEYQIDVLAYDALKNKNLIKYYGGHQFRLGDYFRNLFQIYKLIDSNMRLNDEERKQYSKIIRSQLSTSELYLLFYNTISFFGHEWEFSHLGSDENCIISKYEILKNIPDVNVYNKINIPDYYPDINYDFK